MAIIWKTPPLSTGTKIEQRALQWLTHQGLKPVFQNYSCRAGEIDIIMYHGQQLVFVEVRFRQYSAFGSALESVDRRKQKKLLYTAEHFLIKYPRYASHPCRFDVLAAQPAKGGNKLQWQWIKNAFTG